MPDQLALSALCEAALSRPAPPEVIAFADVLRQRHQGVLAILAYGSSLRGVALSETLIDFYLLTDDFSGVSSRWLSRLGCKLVPPNVYYAEADIAGQTLRAKYAILPLSQFFGRMQRHISNPYFWARFSQPATCIYVRDAASRDLLITACTTALATCYANALGTSTSQNPLTIWSDGFTATYASEFRSEKTSRADQIVNAHANYYLSAATLLKDQPPHRANQNWRRWQGKLLSVARLIKAAFTFQGGADYLVWKIERHSGQKIILTDWQRRHPIIGGLLLLPALLRKGAIR